MGSLRCAVVALSIAALAGCGRETPQAAAEWRNAPWPVTETAFTLSCEQRGEVYVTLDDARRFGINGFAIPKARGFESIQADHDVGPLIQRGLALCSEHRPPIRFVRGPEPPQSVPPEPRASLTQDHDSLSVRIESEDVLDGSRPHVDFNCDREGALAFVHVRRPERGMPQVGLVAAFQFGPASRRELSVAWVGDDSFDFRTDEYDLRDAFLRPWFRSGVVTITPPPQFGADRAISFRTDRLTPAQRLTLARQCGL